MVISEKGITDILLLGDKLFYIQQDNEKNEVYLKSFVNSESTQLFKLPFISRKYPRDDISQYLLKQIGQSFYIISVLTGIIYDAAGQQLYDGHDFADVDEKTIDESHSVKVHFDGKTKVYE